MNMKKYFKSKDKNKNDIIKKCIYLCWISLFICLIIKVIFPQTFISVCTNARLLNLCNFINNNIFARILFVFLFNLILLTPYTLSIYKEKTFNSKRQKHIFLLFVILNSILKTTSKNIIPIIAEIVMFVAYPAFIIFLESRKETDCKHKTIKLCLRPVLLYILFQIFIAISFFIRNVTIRIEVMDNIFLNLIYFSDIFIMVILNYLYNLKLKKRW